MCKIIIKLIYLQLNNSKEYDIIILQQFTCRLLQSDISDGGSNNLKGDTVSGMYAGAKE